MKLNLTMYETKKLLDAICFCIQTLQIHADDPNTTKKEKTMDIASAKFYSDLYMKVAAIAERSPCGRGVEE